MHAIIVGGGRVGRELASNLSEKKQKVVLVEKNPERARALREKLDILVIDGDGANMATLRKAGVDGADILIAVTHIDELNMMVCMMADRAKVPVTIARVRNHSNLSNLADTGFSKEEVGVDYVISPEREVALEISKMIHFPDAEEIEYFSRERVMMVAITVSEKAEVAGKGIREIQLPPECIIVGIKRSDQPIIFPSDIDSISAGDKLYLVGSANNMPQASWLVHPEQTMINKVLILGGGSAGAYLASILENDRERKFTIKLIEKNEARSEELIRSLNKTLVLHGNNSTLSYFNEEEMAETDALVAITGDDQTNIIASVMGEKLGVKKIVAEINNNDYSFVYNRSGVKEYVNSNLITADRILRFTHKEVVLSISHLKEDNLEVVELLVSPSCQVDGKKIRDAGLPKELIIGAIVRKEKIIIPDHETVLQPGDDVIVFTGGDLRHNVESYFC
jgi:trk system potassium uptake protein